MTESITKLHAAYVRGTGLDLRLDHGRECIWGRFIAAGFTLADLLLVIGHIRKGIERGERNRGALKFHNLVGMLDYFEEDLAMAKKQITAKPKAVSQEEAVTRLINEGHSVTVLDHRTPEQEPGAVQDVVKQEMAKFREQMGRPKK